MPPVFDIGNGGPDTASESQRIGRLLLGPREGIAPFPTG